MAEKNYSQIYVWEDKEHRTEEEGYSKKGIIYYYVLSKKPIRCIISDWKVKGVRDLLYENHTLGDKKDFDCKTIFLNKSNEYQTTKVAAVQNYYGTSYKATPFIKKMEICYKNEYGKSEKVNVEEILYERPPEEIAQQVEQRYEKYRSKSLIINQLRPILKIALIIVAIALLIWIVSVCSRCSSKTKETEKSEVSSYTYPEANCPLCGTRWRADTTQAKGIQENGRCGAPWCRRGFKDYYKTVE